jgi:uncharacterized protein
MLTLTQINIFPVKSLDGYSPASAIVEKRGLQYDRRWLITDNNGLFMTQRTNGNMALLRATIEDNTLIIKEKANEANCLKIPIDTESDVFSVTIWNNTVQAALVSKEANAFLSDFLKKDVCLVKMPEATERRVDEMYNQGNDIVSFADGYPFLIIGEASMRNLNERLQHSTNLNTPLSIRRFRSNFVFFGGEPFQEDNFTHFKIGEVNFIGVKNCGRCVLITRDPDTGIKEKEPLKTLQEYRQKGDKILFGQNVVWDFSKWDNSFLPLVRVGDALEL